MYEVSTAAYKFYEAGKVPPDEELLEDLDQLLSLYGQYVDRKTKVRDHNTWIFQANPRYFDLRRALGQLKEMTWSANQYVDTIKTGDTVFLWESGSKAGILAVASVTSDPKAMRQPDYEKVFNTPESDFEGSDPRVGIRINRVLAKQLDRMELQAHSVLGRLTILARPQGTNFKVSREQADAIDALIRDGGGPVGPLPRLDLSAVTKEFAAALLASNVSFGNRHEEVVRSFMASLATKRFAILTGLSGSGKTQLGLQFGHWLGGDYSLVVPVRPDWTGAESLFGYEDALRDAPNGRRAWQVPEALAFMLRASRDPSHPYALILDEMNLAHVERYFADVLSGMESEEDCLPNLAREADGTWRVPVGSPAKVPVPRNLFVVGTVNVDETTYMFSPKVLDRANTFEFRVETRDLESNHEKPLTCSAGDPQLVAGFLTLASDDRWQMDHAAPGQEGFVRALRDVHALLSVAGFEFGHRVFYEAVRFAAFHASAGNTGVMHSVDLQILQKVLPRLHGSRRRLEGTLCALAVFCRDLNYDTQNGLKDAATRYDAPEGSSIVPKLPRSYDKLGRMIAILRANQFVSFTE
jgi:hypothetical protein